MVPSDLLKAILTSQIFTETTATVALTRGGSDKGGQRRTWFQKLWKQHLLLLWQRHCSLLLQRGCCISAICCTMIAKM